MDAHGRAGTFGVAFGPELAEPLFEKVDGIAVPDSPDYLESNRRAAPAGAR